MSLEEKVSAQIHVTGRVQGVGYRYFTERAARDHGVSGWSMNMPDGGVMLEVEADSAAFERFVDELKKGPSMSDVRDVSVRYMPYQGKYKGFSIRF